MQNADGLYRPRRIRSIRIYTLPLPHGRTISKGFKGGKLKMFTLNVNMQTVTVEQDHQTYRCPARGPETHLRQRLTAIKEPAAPVPFWWMAPSRPASRRSPNLKGKEILHGRRTGASGSVRSMSTLSGEAGAVQCGFCIPAWSCAASPSSTAIPIPPGMRSPLPSATTSARCTGYKRIIDAIGLAARLIRERTAEIQASGGHRRGPAGPTPGGRGREGPGLRPVYQ